jgi:type II secretory pathway component PulF
MTADTTPPPLPPIPYAARRPRRWFSLRTTVLAMALTAMLQVNLQLALRWKELFVTFHLRLPGLTQLWFDVADWWTLRFGWAIAWPLAVILPTGITLLRRHPQPHDERVKWVGCAAIILGGLAALVILTYYAATIPMARLVDGITSPL